jgi:hypothetical protein
MCVLGFRILPLDSCNGLDRKYLEYLRDEVKGHLGQDVFLYASQQALELIIN